MPNRVRNLVIGLTVALALTGAAIAGFKRLGPTEAAAAAAGQQQARNALVAAKAAVATRAPDATAMIYGAVAVNWIGETPAVCGQVDIEEPQDSFGGSERFVWSSGEVWIEEFDGSDRLNQQWAALCKSV